MALGSIQPPTKMSTTECPGEKGGRSVRLTTLPSSFVECLEIVGASTSWILSTPVMGKLPYHTQIEEGKIKYLDCFKHKAPFNQRGSSFGDHTFINIIGIKFYQ